MKIGNKGLNYHLPTLLSLLLILVLLFLPTGFEAAAIYQESDLQPAQVLSCDNARLVDTGLVQSGEQRCTIKILGGQFRDQTTEGVNMLNGSLEQDKIFDPGDTALVRINFLDDQILSVSMIDHYRIPGELLLAALFCGLLVLFAGETGVRALLSFVLSVLMIWKVLVPCCLKGINPIWISLAVVMLLTVFIIALVYGFDRKTASAVAGCALGIGVTCVTGILFTSQFKIHGAVMSYSESLLYAGYSGLNLTQIFMASIFIGASGAIMDLAVDITSAVNEVVEKKPTISWQEAVKSGMTVGRAALGTQTTTLLLAYSGGFLALMMVFMAQGTPISTIFNLKYVASEILHTVVGSFGLCTVAPLTALTSGILLTRSQRAGKGTLEKNSNLPG